jgi:hypothetical protein
MSLLEQYIEELGEDTQMSELDIKDVQMKLPAIKHKYAGRLVRAKIQLSQLYNKRDAIRKDVVERLKEESPYQLSDAVAAKTADKHTSISTIQAEIYETKIIIELLEKAERIFNSMTFDIKNMIDIMKLEIE